jgi:hypothetical protein
VHESILAFRKRRYLWVALLLVVLCLAAYWVDDPQEPANGGTVLGYTLGTLGALLIVWLTWFGIRKRRYASTLGTTQGWLSAHVYLGLALVVVVLLHTGFQFGWNIHTLAFVLMILVVTSGAWGVYSYMKHPERISENRDGANRNELLDQLDDIDRRSRKIATCLPEQYRDVIDSGVRRTQLGSSLWERLRGRDNSQLILPKSSGTGVVANAGQEAALDWFAEQQSMASDPVDAAKIVELSALLRNKRRLLRKLKEDMRLQAAVEIWLYAHVPLTAGLLMALAAHIISVFLYW